MSSISHVNRELARLDGELRGGGIDRQSFRNQRRKLLQDFDERQTTTTPAATGAGDEETVVDPPMEVPFDRASSPASPSADPTPAARRSPPMGMAVIGLSGLVVVAIGAWWLLSDRSGAANSNPRAAAPVAAAAPAPNSATELPQNVAAALLETEWTDADVADFLQRWSRVSPEAVNAAKDDARIWLLRGETDRRLRDARDAESVDHSPEAVVRIQQLEQVQAAIKSP